MLLVLNGIIDVGIGSIITLLIMFNKEQKNKIFEKVLKKKISDMEKLVYEGQTCIFDNDTWKF